MYSVLRLAWAGKKFKDFAVFFKKKTEKIQRVHNSWWQDYRSYKNFQKVPSLYLFCPLAPVISLGLMVILSTGSRRLTSGVPFANSF